MCWGNWRKCRCVEIGPARRIPVNRAGLAALRATCWKSTRILRPFLCARVVVYVSFISLAFKHLIILSSDINLMKQRLTVAAEMLATSNLRLARRHLILGLCELPLRHNDLANRRSCRHENSPVPKRNTTINRTRRASENRKQQNRTRRTMASAHKQPAASRRSTLTRRTPTDTTHHQ
jgi:hypothetical protein